MMSVCGRAGVGVSPSLRVREVDTVARPTIIDRPSGARDFEDGDGMDGSCVWAGFQALRSLPPSGLFMLAVGAGRLNLAESFAISESQEVAHRYPALPG